MKCLTHLTTAFAIALLGLGCSGSLAPQETAADADDSRLRRDGGRRDAGQSPPPCPSGGLRLTTDLHVGADLASDHSAAINAALKSVPAGSTVWLEGIYRIDAAILIDETFPKGVTLAPACGLPAGAVGFQRLDAFDASEVGVARQSQASQLLVLSGTSGWVLRGFSLIGYHRRAIYNVRFEPEKALSLGSCEGCVADGLRIRGVGADFVYLSEGAQNITLKNITGDIALRQGISPIDTDGGIVFEGVAISRIGRSGIDLEPIAKIGQKSVGVTFKSCVVEGFRNWGLAMGGDGLHSQNRFEGVSVRGGIGWMLGGRPGDGDLTVVGGGYHHLGNAIDAVFTRSVTGFVDRTDDVWSGNPLPLPSGELYLGRQEPFNLLDVEILSAGSGGLPIVEYWSGTTWKTASVKQDGTSGLSHSGAIELGAASDWQPQVLLGAPDEPNVPADQVLRWTGTAWDVRLDSASDASYLSNVDTEWPYTSGNKSTLFSGAADQLYIGRKSPFEAVKLYLRQAAVSPAVLSWEYFDGSGWLPLQVNDETQGLTQTRQIISWAAPPKWTATVPAPGGIALPSLPGDPATRAYYYVRARITAAPAVPITAFAVWSQGHRLYWVRLRAPSASGAVLGKIRTNGSSRAAAALVDFQSLTVEDTEAHFSTGGRIRLGASQGSILRNVFSGVDQGLLIESGGTHAIGVADNLVTGRDGGPAPIVVQ